MEDDGFKIPVSRSPAPIPRAFGWLSDEFYHATSFFIRQHLLPVLFCCSSTVKKNTSGRGGVPTIPGRLIGCSGVPIHDG
jgi:hypothetical protein